MHLLNHRNSIHQIHETTLNEAFLYLTDRSRDPFGQVSLLCHEEVLALESSHGCALIHVNGSIIIVCRLTCTFVRT